jgi:hypothetical protein
MASEHSYTITLDNNRTEKAAIDYLLAVSDHYWVPNAVSRKAILGALGVSPSLWRAFDLVRVEDAGGVEGGMLVADPETIVLVELKTTRKRLADLPRGFFFGATENEFALARSLGDRFRFCFVCLHPDTPGYVEVTAAELELLIRNRRTQYQINL